MSVLWDCNLRSNLRVQQRLSSKYCLSTLTCYHHYLLLLRNQPKQQQSNMRRTFWFGGGEGKKESCHKPRESSFLPSATLPQLLLLKGQRRVASQKQAHPWSCSFHNKSSQNTRALLCPKSYHSMRGAKFTLLRVLSSRWSDGFWRGTVVFLRTLYSYKHMKKMDNFFFRDIALLIYSPWVFKLQLRPLWWQVGFIILQTY